MSRAEGRKLLSQVIQEVFALTMETSLGQRKRPRILLVLVREGQIGTAHWITGFGQSNQARVWDGDETVLRTVSSMEMQCLGATAGVSFLYLLETRPLQMSKKVSPGG